MLKAGNAVGSHSVHVETLHAQAACTPVEDLEAGRAGSRELHHSGHCLGSQRHRGEGDGPVSVSASLSTKGSQPSQTQLLPLSGLYSLRGPGNKACTGPQLRRDSGFLGLLSKADLTCGAPVSVRLHRAATCGGCLVPDTGSGWFSSSIVGSVGGQQEREEERKGGREHP